MNYSISPLTKILKENNVPTSPLVKSRDRYGKQRWIQTKDGYSWSKSRDSSDVWFYVQGQDVFNRMVEVFIENGIEIQSKSKNSIYGGEISIDILQFYNK